MNISLDDAKKLLQQVDALKQENEALRSMLTMYNIGGCTDIIRAAEDMADLRTRLSAANNELDTLRKVVWHLTLKPAYHAWAISVDVEKHNNLDIKALQEEMGK